MRRSKVVGLAIATSISLALTATGCSSTSGSSNGTTPTTAPPPGPGGCAQAGADFAPKPATLNGVTVTGALNVAPTLTVAPDAKKPTTVVKTDVAVGCGDVVKPDSDLIANYVNYIFPSSTPNQSSWEQGQPAPLSMQGVIPCWQQGVLGMKAGGRRLIICTPESAYGAAGSPPGIPANATLTFVVQVNEVTPALTYR